MPNETSKALKRLETDPLWLEAANAGGPWLDIGGGENCLPTAELYDQAQGDANTCANLPDNHYGLVWSSHTLEHMIRHPAVVVERWFELVRPGGWLWIVVPHADLYEHGFWPSHFNGDHKWRFGLEYRDWPNYLPLVSVIPADSWPVRMQLADQGYDYSRLTKPQDQTADKAEAACELVIRKFPL